MPASHHRDVLAQRAQVDGERSEGPQRSNGASERAWIERSVRLMSKADPVGAHLMIMDHAEVGSVVALTCRAAISEPARFRLSPKGGRLTPPYTVAQPVGPTRRLWRNYQGKRLQFRQALCQAGPGTADRR